MKPWQKAVLSAEQWFLTLLFFALLGVATAQIVLRNFFDSGLLWGDDFIKISVLWIAMMGAAYATRNSRHINVDVVTRFLPVNKGRWIYRFVYGATSIICGLSSYHTYQFVMLEKEDGMIAFGNIPVWMTELIIPMGFALMAWRFLVLVLVPKRAQQTTEHH